MNHRDQTLDVAKGMLIIFVVLGHAIQYSFGEEYTTSKLFFDNIVFKAIYTFHMPLFMLISGYLFYNSNKKDTKTLVISKLKAIGLPMISFIILCNIPRYFDLIAQGDLGGFTLSYFKTVISEIFGRGGTMWFLFSILLNIAIFIIITRLVRNVKAQYIIMFFVCIVSLFVPDTILSGVYKFMFPFFCIGYILKENDVPLYSAERNKLAMITLVLLTIASVAWYGRETYIYTTGYCIIGDWTNQLYVDIKRFIIALVVSYTFMQYVHIVSLKMKNVFGNCCLKLGQISLFIYGFNILFDAIYCKVFSHYAINFDFNYIIPILFAICVIAIALCLHKLLERNKVLSMMLLGK